MNASSAFAPSSMAPAISGETSCKFCPKGGMLPEDYHAALDYFDSRAVKMLFSILSPLLLFAGIGSLASSWGQISAALLTAQVVLLATLGVSAAVVYSGIDLTYFRLRLLEGGIFLAGMILISLHALGVSAEAAAVHYLYGVAGGLLLILAYGIFVPNPLPRAVLMVMVLMAVPLACGAVLSFQGAFAQPAFQFWIPALMLVLAGGISSGASAHVTAYRDYSNDRKESDLYHLKRRIGQGGMGEVWLAEHKLLARPSAMKMIRPEKLDGESADAQRRARDRFEREAKVTASLRSPHTVELYDFGVTADGTFFYVMELLEGFDLDTLVQRHGPLPAERVVHLLLQVCDSLGDAHENGLVHRDIKPANIYVARMGLTSDFVKVLDFGLVKTVDPRLTKSNLTIEGVTTGTPAFMAPEMARGKGDVDHRTDLYSLGCVAYWLLTGQLVFDSDNPLSIVVDHVNTDPVPPSGRSELEIPAELDSIILKCLAKDPGQRFQSAGDLSAALSAVPLATSWDTSRATEWWKLHQPRNSRPAA